MTIPRWLAWPLLTLPWIAVMSVVFYFCLLRFPLDGVKRFSFAFDGSSPWLDAFLPGQRVTAPGIQSDDWIGQRIFQEPVYASARVPGPYDRVDVSFEMRTTHQSLAEMGLLRDPAAFLFELHPLWSEKLSEGWRLVEKQGVRGFVRQGISDEALLTHDTEHVLTWQATTTAINQMDLTQPERAYPISLRGGHEMYVVPTAGEIFFRFDLQDVNRTRGGNVVAVRVSHDDETIWTDAVASSGRLDRRPDQAFQEVVHLHDVKAGIYRLSLIMDDDVFIRNISTTAQHWVFGPRFYAGDVVGYATTTQAVRVWTNSRHLSLTTMHPEGLQTVSLGRKTVQVAKTHQVYPLDRVQDEQGGAVLLQIPQGDMRVVGDGYVALSPDALFLPYPRRLTDASDPLKEGVDVILTSYEPPQLLGDGWWRVRTSFDLQHPLPDFLKFSLSLPGIVSRDGAVDIRAVRLEYHRPALSWSGWWQTVKQELVGVWKHL